MAKTMTGKAKNPAGAPTAAGRKLSKAGTRGGVAAAKASKPGYVPGTAGSVKGGGR